MKKQIFKVSLLAFFAAVMSISSYGQSDRVWSTGPELGASFSKHGMDADDSDYKLGLVAGGFVTYSIKNTYAFTAKILFSQKGAQDEFDGPGDDITIKEQLNYVEIPVLARLFFNREGNVRPNVFVGPSFGFLTGAKLKVGDDDYENFEDVEGSELIYGDIDSYKDVYNGFDFGMSAGLGLNIRVAEEMYLIVDARYTYGFTNIAKEGDDKINNQPIAITAGLSFGIGN